MASALLLPPLHPSKKKAAKYQGERTEHHASRTPIHREFVVAAARWRCHLMKNTCANVQTRRRVMVNSSRRLALNAAIAIALLAIVASCAHAAPATPSPGMTRIESAAVQALWSRSVTGAALNANIYDGVILFGVNRRPYGDASTQAVDLLTGRLLWEQTGALPLSGSPSFLAAGEAVERVAVPTGRVIWRSVQLCTSPYAWMHTPTSVAIIRDSAYVGCSGGRIVGLRLSDGHVFAAAHPAVLDGYDQIIALGDGTLGLGGWADGAHMQRRGAIVKRDTLATVAALHDKRILGSWDGRALVESYDWATDTALADIALVSLTSGETLHTASLHPYAQPPPADRKFPEPVVVLPIGNTLYVGTHNALFAYDLRNLEARPRILYDNLANLPTVIDDRYFSIERGKRDGMRSNAVLDAYHGMRVIYNGMIPPAEPVHVKGSTRRLLRFIDGGVRSANIDASCMLSASDERYAFMACGNVDIASRTHVGGPPKPITLTGRGTMLPESIAVYALTRPVR